MRIALPYDPAGSAAPVPRRRTRTPRGFLLLWAAAVLVPMLGVVGAGFLTWKDVRQEAVARIDRSVEMLRHHALRAFATQDAILTAVARATDGMEWPAIRENAGLHDMMAGLAQSGRPLVRGVLIVDGQGRIALASWEFPTRALDVSDRDYVHDMLSEPSIDGVPPPHVAVGEVITSRPMGWQAFPVARRAPPRRSDAGGPGLLVTGFNPEPLAEFYASVAETPRDEVMLLRLDGAVLARYPAPPEGDDAAARSRRQQLLATVLPNATTRPAESPVESADGVPRLMVARQLGEWPVAVTYGLSLHALRATWRHRMMAPIAGGTAAALLLLALTGLAARGARQQQMAVEQRMEAETQLAQAGRAAAIGLLAAGLAHDVKNLVQAVRSGARLIDRRAEDAAEVRRCAVLLDDAAERGRRLVEAMLAFARGGSQGVEAAPPLEVGRALSDLVELLNRTLGSGWRVATVIPPGLPPARGDQSGFEAAVVNLAANARDAMPKGGTVTIAAWVEDLPEAADDVGLRAGRYVVAAVSDSGAGMSPETLARVGEPFFTTKGPSRGTGLGLATVRGFCARSGGALRLDSELGRGTTAAMWLPAA